MNNIFKFFTIALISLTFASCTNNATTEIEALKDYKEQYAKDLDSIDKYIDNHYITVDADFNVILTKIPTGGTQQSIRQQTQYPLLSKIVHIEEHDVDYKVYYLKLREGVNKRPSMVDSIHVSYRGTTLSDSQFDYSPNPIWFQLQDVVAGWGQIIPEFKTGTYSTVSGPNPVNFQDYGAGVMFLPSGLAYYQNSSPTGSFGPYSPLIFSFKLTELRYKDHDLDGVLSKDEFIDDPAELYDDIYDTDTDGDGLANMFDIDDDGDKIKTKNEIHKDANGLIIFEDCDGDGIPNYLDKDICL
jgi:hypothetical protein